MFLPGVRKNRGESPNQRRSEGMLYGLYPDEVTVMRFLENAYMAGQDMVTRDVLYNGMRQHAMTKERIGIVFKRLSKIKYLTFTDDTKLCVRLQRFMAENALPERLIVIENGIRKIVCPPAYALGYGFDRIEKPKY